MLESAVEKHLHREVRKAGGDTRKFKGRIHVPDRIVIWPRRLQPLNLKTNAEIHFVETKAPGKTARAGQAREHKRLRKLGCQVFVIDTKSKADLYISKYRP